MIRAPPNHGAMLNSETAKNNNDLSLNIGVRISTWQFFASMKYHLSDVSMRSIGRGRRHLYALVVCPVLSRSTSDLHPNSAVAYQSQKEENPCLKQRSVQIQPVAVPRPRETDSVALTVKP